MPALWGGAYGADSYLRAFLPAIERYGSRLELVVLVIGNKESLPAPRRNITYVRAPVPVWAGRHLRTLWEQHALPRLLDRLAVDVVYTGRNVGVLRSPKPCVIAVCNMDPLVPKFGRETWTLRFNSALRGFLSRASIRAAKRVVAVSQYVKDVLVGMGTGASKIDVVYYGVDDVELVTDGGASAPHVAAASKFIRYANLTTLVRAYHRMRERGFTGDLRLAGGSLDRAYEGEVRKLVSDLGLAPRVRFLGYVPRGEVQGLLGAATVVLHASRLEACPFTLLEAMRQGAPIVTTTAGPMPEICGDAALYANPDDAAGMGEAAYRIASSPELRSSLRERARARAARFTWEDSVRRLSEALERAARG